MLKIPNVTTVCVEIPGTVSNPENAIKALGGLDGIEESICSRKSIKLSFCPDDPYTRPICSDFMKRSGILLKKLKYRDGNIQWRVLGNVSLIHQFTQMADFYFIPPSDFREKKTIHEHLNEEIPETAFIPPAVFSRVTHPVNIKWTSNMSTTLNETVDQNESEEVEEKTENTQYWTPVAKYSDITIPNSPLKISSSINLDKNALGVIKKLFNEQPLWLRPVIESKISSEISSWKKKLLFTQVCYNISDGPWRACLCRLGYDPRTDPESRIYQTLDFRDPYLRKVMKDKKIGIINKTEEDTGESPSDWQFKVPPKRGSQLYQLCNIEDSHIRKLINEAQPLESCTKESGWFKKSVLSQIRELLSLKCQQMRQIEQNS
ncbi:hypothetical protein FG386_001833 [Cryptosporidium ryanae]|uniref:uncharacterized protein n=1 Tax=Cryptosporidium ryanae TaxID=515981 RepID=UPI00351AA6EC|nr:hypothetical protein FG386_001833 [Cryptosporidium ryanae]